MSLEARDLDPAREVYRTPTGTVVHLRRGCPRLTNADVYETTAGVEFDDKDVCGRCRTEEAGDLGGFGA
jgi:hypothetical protein